MKNIKKYLPYMIAIALQFVIPNYFLLVLTTIIIGLISCFFIPSDKIFIKSFCLALIVFVTVFFMYKSRVLYLESILNNFGLPDYSLYIVFPVFNALNVSILFFLGYRLATLFSKVVIKNKLKEV